MNRERVQMLRNMIAGIPDDRINLDVFIRGNGTPCGSVACIMGWAMMYPPFKKARIGRTPWRFFNLPVGSRLFLYKLPNERGTDKQIALRRLDKLLKWE